MTIQSQAALRVAVRRAARRAGILADREAAKPAPQDTIWDSAPVNPRYAAYCRAHPGGSNAGFLGWLPSKLAEWRSSIGRPNARTLTAAEQADFDAWLETHAVEMEACPKCAS